MSKALSVSLEVPTSPGTYSAALEGLTGVNEILLRRNPSLPSLYGSGARWEIREQDPTDKRWRYAPEVAIEGWGDCQALSTYRAAELRVSGEDPQARVRVYPTGPDTFHAVVARGNGLVEDPSVILGMDPIRGAPMTTSQLPMVAGIREGDPIIAGVRRSLTALHPGYCSVSGGCFGDETGQSEKLARIRDVSPEIAGPTFHIAPHRVNGRVCGWKGVHRIPLKDGTAIVGMTATRDRPEIVVGDATSLVSSIGNAILNHPIISALISPEAYIATRALMDPSIQHGLKKTADTANASASASDDGWPSVWGATRNPNIVALNKQAAQQRGATRTRDTSSFAYTRTSPQSRQSPGQTPGMSPSGFGGFNPPMLDPMTGQPFPPGMSPSGFGGFNPSMGPPGSFGTATSMLNPMTGQPFPPGTTPMGMMQAYQAAQQGYGGGGGMTSADFGLPATPNYDPSPDYGGFASFDPTGGVGDTVFDDSNASALQSYYDPMSQIGYWNT
jgi:hypothetical protein